VNLSNPASEPAPADPSAPPPAAAHFTPPLPPRRYYRPGRPCAASREANYLLLGRWPSCCAVMLGVRLTLSRELRVESDPPGASLFINGRLAGKTPLGRHRSARRRLQFAPRKEHYTPLSLP